MSKKTSKISFIGGLAVAILLPLSFYFIMVALTRNVIHMPRYYGIEKIDTATIDGKTTYDTIYHQVADIQLINQLGQKVSLNNNLKGKALLINFFYINCPATCSKRTQNMAGLMQRAFKKNDSIIQFISITINPAADSFPALRNYADKYGADHDHWWFLTGDRQNIYTYARNQLLLPMFAGNDSTMIHTNDFVLVDKDRYVRGYYNGLDTAALKRCADDIILVAYQNRHRKKHRAKH